MGLLFTEVEFNEDTDGFLVDKPPEEYLDDLMLGAYTGEVLFKQYSYIYFKTTMSIAYKIYVGWKLKLNSSRTIVKFDLTLLFCFVLGEKEEQTQRFSDQTCEPLFDDLITDSGWYCYDGPKWLQYE